MLGIAAVAAIAVIIRPVIIAAFVVMRGGNAVAIDLDVITMLLAAVLLPFIIRAMWKGGRRDNPQ
jgi:hypothetical protein